MKIKIVSIVEHGRTFDWMVLQAIWYYRRVYGRITNCSRPLTSGSTAKLIDALRAAKEIEREYASEQKQKAIVGYLKK